MRLIDADALDIAFGELRFDQDFNLAHWGDRPNWCLHGYEIERLIEKAPTVEAVAIDKLCALLGEKGFPHCRGLCGECEPPKTPTECWKSYIEKLMEEKKV